MEVADYIVPIKVSIAQSPDCYQTMSSPSAVPLTPPDTRSIVLRTLALLRGSSVLPRLTPPRNAPHSFRHYYSAGPRARKVPGFVHEKMTRFLYVYLDCGHIPPALTAADITRRQYNNWLNQYPAFAADVDDIRQEHAEYRIIPILEAARAGHAPSIRKAPALFRSLTKPKTRQPKQNFAEAGNSGNYILGVPGWENAVMKSCLLYNRLMASRLSA